jgi:2,4-dienoyl-CoA reductase-like NADH-dependent reductase (Old Yellow Enzyme family)
MSVHHSAGAGTDSSRTGDARLLAESVSLRCGAVLPNRIAKSAMSEQLGTVAGAPDDRIVRLYERFGRSGTGLLITGNVMIDRRALGEPGNIVFDGPEHLKTLRRWSAAGKAEGSHVWVQINHPGRQVPRGLAAHPVAPSAVPLRVARGVFGRPRAMRDDEIHETIVRFGRSAALAREAGFDGIQVHGAHGYLISQFLSPVSNRRDDSWGGSLDNRMRFARCVVREIRRQVGADFAIGFKLNCSDFTRGGFTAEEAITVARMLDAEGVDLVELSGGGYEKAVMFDVAARPGSPREAFFAEFAGRIAISVETRVMLTGGNRTLAQMARGVRDGLMDVAGLGRPLAANPEFTGELLAAHDSEPPVPGSLRARTLDAFVQTAWHERQMHRLAAGREVAPRMSATGALAWGVWRNTYVARRVRRRARNDGLNGF